MADPDILTQTPGDLVDELAWGLLDSAWLLPEAPRKGRVRPGLEDCRAIARKMVERLQAHGVVEIRRQIRPLHGSAFRGGG